MVEAAFVSFAVQKLGDFLIHEASLRLNLRQDVQWLQNELFFIQSFLKDAEKKQVEDQRVQQWIFEINSVANEAVAILETYSFEASKIDDDKEKKFYDFANEIQSLKQRIMDDVETLLAELVKAEPRRSIISIYGMGGLGKTTLVRKLYNSLNIVSSFYTRAWICVSQEYNTIDLLTNIVKSIQGRTKEILDLLERMTETDLEIYLRDLLKERKYLVVVDDLWHREAWGSLKRAFPDSKNGGRVIITTRKEDAAERADNKWLWITEGFVPTGEEIMEDVVEGFLNELIRRSLIQVVLTFWEKVSKCRIHNLLRDLAVQKALEVNFFDIYDPRKHSISSLCLRHAIHSQGKRYLSLDLSNLKLRSLMFLDLDFLKMSLIKFRNVFQHLYVLYLEIRVDTHTISILPDAIGSLYHLKFLRLRGIHDLPSSIGKLKNLQTLVVNDWILLSTTPRDS